jgi:excisionase family DNA binding protein
MDEILKKLDQLEQLIKSQKIYLKEVLTFHEGCDYCTFTPSHMYKLTSMDGIPHYKPNGKLIFFRRSELDTWLLRNRNVTRDELQQAISAYINEKRRG